MKILYSAGDRIGSSFQLQRFLENSSDKHNIKIAAYQKSSLFTREVDWLLNAVSTNYVHRDARKYGKIFEAVDSPGVSIKTCKLLMEDVEYFEPDLIICDGEPILASVAKHFNLKLWYCSPVHLWNGIAWGKNCENKYGSRIDLLRKDIFRYPEPDRAFIYSPFGDMKSGPQLLGGYEWVSPYTKNIKCNGDGASAFVCWGKRYEELTKILRGSLSFNKEIFSYPDAGYLNSLSKSKWLFFEGQTSILADAIYGGIGRLCISPDLDDIEAILNALLVNMFNLGDDVGQVEFMEKYAVDEIERSFEKTANRNRVLGINNHKTLSELIDEESR